MSMKWSYKALLMASLAAAVFGAPYSLTFAETSGSTDVKLSIDPTLSIALSTNNVEFDIDTPNLLTNNMTVTGATNSANGYTISVNANNAYTSLKHENQGVSENIPTLSEVSSVASFPNVAWGYTNSLSSMSDEVSSSTNFRPISQSATNVFETSAYGSSSHIFTTGVKVGSTIPAGAYSNDLLFTIVANYVEEPEEPLVPYPDVAVTNHESLMNRKYSSAIDPLFQKYFVGQPSDFSASRNGNVFSASGAFTGDYYEAISQWLIDVTNIGSNDAMFAGAPIITGLTDEQKEFMEARITYKYGTQMRKGDLLSAGETEQILIRLQYKEGYTGPLHTNENISLSIEFPYAVANNIARKAKDGEGWVYMPKTSNYVYSNDNITMLDWRRPSDGRSKAFPDLKDDGVIVSFQTADTLDLSNAVTLDSGEKFYDLSIKKDGSLIGWYELNEDGIDYDGPQYSDRKFYDYYVYSTIGKVIVDACDFLFDSSNTEFRFTSKMDLHGFDFERCTSSQMMFQKVGAVGLGYSGNDVEVPFTLDLGDWTGQNLLIFYDTFIDTGRNHPNGAEIIFSDNFNPINLRHARYAFHFFGAETNNLTVDISGWDLSNLLDASFMFADLGENSTGTITINMEGVTTPRLANAGSMFFNIGASNASRVVINAPDLTFDNVVDMSYMFSATCGHSKSYPDTICDINMKIKSPNVTNMRRMFFGTGNLIGSPDLDLSEFDTSSVTDMGEMFGYTWIEKVVEKVGFDNFNTSNVSDMTSMFGSVQVSNPSAESITIDLSHFNTPSLTKANYFLSLSNIYTPGVTYTYNLKNVTIDMSNFDFSGVTDITGSYARLLQFDSNIEKVTVYVKDQAAKDFVENHVIIYSYPQFYYQFQDGDVVIK